LTIAVTLATTIKYKRVTLADRSRFTPVQAQKVTRTAGLLRVPTSCLPILANQVLLGSFELSHDASLLHNNFTNGIINNFIKNFFKFVDGNHFMHRHLLDHSFVGLRGIDELFALHHSVVSNHGKRHRVFFRISLIRHERGFGDKHWLLGHHRPRSMVMPRVVVSHGLR